MRFISKLSSIHSLLCFVKLSRTRWWTIELKQVCAAIFSAQKKKRIQRWGGACFGCWLWSHDWTSLVAWTKPKYLNMFLNVRHVWLDFRTLIVIAILSLTRSGWEAWTTTSENLLHFYCITGQVVQCNTDKKSAGIIPGKNVFPALITHNILNSVLMCASNPVKNVSG